MNMDRRGFIETCCAAMFAASVDNNPTQVNFPSSPSPLVRHDWRIGGWCCPDVQNETSCFVPVIFHDLTIRIDDDIHRAIRAMPHVVARINAYPVWIVDHVCPKETLMLSSVIIGDEHAALSFTEVRVKASDSSVIGSRIGGWNHRFDRGRNGWFHTPMPFHHKPVDFLESLPTVMPRSVFDWHGRRCA